MEISAYNVIRLYLQVKPKVYDENNTNSYYLYNFVALMVVEKMYCDLIAPYA